MEINNRLNIENEKNNFFNNTFGKTINYAIDIGLRAILPDLIENQVIDIKNSLLNNGLKTGIDTAINSAVNFGKSTAGIFTGNFENIEQVKIAIGNGGIVDSISDVLDNVIKNGKNVLLNNVSNNIKKELDEQVEYVKKMESEVSEWKKCYNNKDFDGMEKAYKKIEKQYEKIVPIENLINETKQVKALHELIKNNGKNFNITEDEKRLAKNLA